MKTSKWFWPDTWPKVLLVWAMVMMVLYVAILAFNTMLYGFAQASQPTEVINLFIIGGPSLLIGLLVIKANLILQKQLHVLATTDELTGLRNRRAFFDKANRVAAENGGLLVILDADFFKQINDSFGHAAGDDALIEVGELLKTAARDQDVLGRLGGEEFGLFLSSVALKDARGILRRLCAGVTLHHADGRQMTLSAGGALMEPGESMDDTFRRADEALYAAKRMGRKRFVFAGDLTESVAKQPRRSINAA